MDLKLGDKTSPGHRQQRWHRRGHRSLAAEGVAVVVHGRDDQKTRSVAAAIISAGGTRVGWGNDIAKAREHALKNITNQTVQRLGEMNDIASAVTYLGSSLADFIAGTNLHVDAGSLPTIN